MVEVDPGGTGCVKMDQNRIHSALSFLDCTLRHTEKVSHFLTCLVVGIALGLKGREACAMLGPF
jgi:hypothetical protein